jgi:hypothetical protein
MIDEELDTVFLCLIVVAIVLGEGDANIRF